MAQILEDFTNGSQMGRRSTETDEQRRERWAALTKAALVKVARERYGLGLKGTKKNMLDTFLKQTIG